MGHDDYDHLRESADEAMRASTDYKNQSNRCPRCGHRLDMAEGKRCTVETGTCDQHGKLVLGSSDPCECRRHYR